MALCPCNALYHHAGQPEKGLGIKKKNHRNNGGDDQWHYAKRWRFLHPILKHRVFWPAEECPVNEGYEVSCV
jgi:hypothetical protein